MILCAGFLFSANIELYDRSLTEQEVQILQKLVILMTLNTAVFLPFNVFSSVVTAYERYIFQKLIGLLSGIVTPLLNLVMLYAGFGSVGLVAAATMLNFVTYGIYTWYAIRKLNVTPRFGKTAPGILREILNYSAFIFLASIVDVLYWSTDKLIIG